MDKFIIENKITLSDYKKLQIKLTYSKLWMVIISIFAVIYLAVSLIMLTIGSYDLFYSDWYPLGLLICIAAIYAPLSALIFSGIGYKRNQQLQESIIYNFSEQRLEIQGQSFTSMFMWDKLYKVRSIKGWLLIYQNWLVANVIKIENNDIDKINKLKQYIKSKGFKIKIT